MRTKQEFALLFAFGFVGITDAAHGDIVITSVSRSVTAVADHFGTPGETHTSKMPGLFLETAQSQWAFGVSSALVISGQESLTPASIGTDLTGLGIIQSQVVVGFGGAGGGWCGDNIFDAQFTVDADSSYQLEALVGWTGSFLSGPADANFSLVELRDETNDQQLFFVSRSGPIQGTQSLVETINLQTGISYSLRAHARVDGGTSTPGNYGVGAGWDFDFSESTQPFLLGDVNQDGLVNLLDVQPFVDLLTSGQFQAEADINQDGVVNLLDVAPFVSILTGG